MRWPYKMLMGILPLLLNGCLLLNMAEIASYKIRTAGDRPKTYEKTHEEWQDYVARRDAVYEELKRDYKGLKNPEWWKPYKEQRDLIYSRMKYYGVNREDMAALVRLKNTSNPFFFDPYAWIDGEKFFKPGEHYRFEMDEYILTMKVPDVPYGMGGDSIYPYLDTRSPVDERAKKNWGNRLFDFGWHISNTLFSNSDTWGCGAYYSDFKSIHYYALASKEEKDFATPEALRQHISKTMKKSIIPEEKIQEARRRGLILNGGGDRVLMDSTLVTINGRRWIHTMMEEEYGRKRRHHYATTLWPDKKIVITCGLPRFDYKPGLDPSEYPSYLRRALEQMNEMIASIRIAKVNDDGSFDPFVIERVEPAPPPVREKPLPPRNASEMEP